MAMNDVSQNSVLEDSFEQESDSKVWVSRFSEPISYTDGESQNKISRLLASAKDLSSTSSELEGLINDWPTLYHLSSRRSNLLRPLKSIFSKGTVLEIGAGCGAITRYLGENADTVYALEGSLERARICAQRCRDLDNVHVLCSSFIDFRITEKFDTIFLIGVLEYSRIYCGGMEGPANMLALIKSMLKEDGKLVIAIENQLGLKYFSGVNEDHINKPWISVGDNYPANDAVTFGHAELEKLVKGAEFQNVNYLIPVPDYKLPLTVLDAGGLTESRQYGFNAASILSTSCSADVQSLHRSLFPLETAWQAVDRNELSLELANSFLLVASNSNLKTSDKLPVMYHYGAFRKPEFLKETLVYLDGTELKVKITPYYNIQQQPEAPYCTEWQDADYRTGKLYFEDLIYILNQDGWKVHDLAEWVKPWLEILCADLSDHNKTGQSMLYATLPVNYLDATPFNLIKDKNGKMQFIDLEWISSDPPTLIHVLLRGLLGCFDKISSVAKPDPAVLSTSILYILKELFLELGFKWEQELIAKTLEKEALFREFVTGLKSKLDHNYLQAYSLFTRHSVQNANQQDNSELDETKLKFFTASAASINRLNFSIASENELKKEKRIAELKQILAKDESANKANLASRPLKKAPLKAILRFLLRRSVVKPIWAKSGFMGLLRIIKQWYSINRTGIFDSVFYLRTNPDAVRAKLDPLFHYILFGAKLGHQPNLLFYGKWYDLHYSLDLPEHINPLYHYIVSGSKVDYFPHPLFDSSFYRKKFKANYPGGMSALEHYLRIGRHNGISPHPLFVSEYYNQKSGQNLEDPLTAYIESWNQLQANPHPFFDQDYYLHNNKDVRLAGANPLIHFCLHGFEEQRDPSPYFSLEEYYFHNSDVRGAGVNPLIHFIKHGISENRKTGSVAARTYRRLSLGEQKLTSNKQLLQPAAVSPAQWRSITAQSSDFDRKTVDIVIPVYKGRLETLACIYSVLKSETKVPYRLIVVNDKSPDEELSDNLRKLAADGNFTLIENEQNSGFVQSVNIGMQQSESNDVLLLNSDTEVFSGWLDRIQDAALSASDIGTVTPLSNSATICSYPYFCEDSAILHEVTPHKMDQLAASCNGDIKINTPTAVGFCMYIKRECINTVGYFDREKFGAGYGEENDFCLRAAKKGWTNIITPNVYVLHYGSTSFGNDVKNKQVEKALKVIQRDHPDYLDDVRKFVENNPLYEAHLRLDIARLKLTLHRQVFLFITHRRGGGTLQYMEDLAHKLFDRNISVIYLESHPEVFGSSTIRSRDLDRSSIPTLSKLNFDQNPRLLSQFIDLMGISHVHIHSLVDFTEDAAVWISRACEMAHKEFDITVHDYAWICPQITMVDETRKFCGGQEEQKCADCVQRISSNWGRIDTRKFLADNSMLFKSARKVICPSEDVKDRIYNVIPTSNLEYLPHACNTKQVKTAKAGISLTKTRKIALIGAIGIHKGSEVLLDCVRDAEARNLDIEFIVLGYADRQEQFDKYKKIRFTGKYENAEAVNILRSEGCDLCLFISVWPETFSYTFNVAIAAGLFPVSLDIGAVAERIRRLGWGKIIDFNLCKDPREINDILLTVDCSKQPDLEKIKSEFAEYPDILQDYYDISFQGL